MKQQFSFFFVLRELLGIRFKALGWLNIPPILISVLRGLVWVLGVISMHFLFDAVADAVREPEIGMRLVMFGFLFAGGIMLAEIIMNNLGSYVQRIQDVTFKRVLADKMNRTAANADPIAYEDSHHLNDIEKAREAAMGWSTHAFTWGFIELFTFYAPFLTFLIVYLYNLRPILPLILVIIALPMIIEQVVKTRIMAEAENRAAPLRRASEHYENTMVAREYLKETRQLGAYGFFFGLYYKTMSLFTKERWKALSKVRLYDLVFRVL